MSAFLTVVIENCEILKRNSCFYKTYRALHIFFSSPMNKSENLKVILHTSSNVMIELDTLLEIPSDIEEYSETMEYLSKRMKLKASNGKVLAKVVKSKIGEILNPNTYRLGLSTEGKVLELNPNNNYTLFLNLADKDGHEVEYDIRVSNYELGVDATCGRVLSLFEEALEIF
ncbi:Ribosomal RNA small subunit methyltransferase NEP1 [Nosema granulosis]|uniref:Ribosomal RNA small subunit methyltransferase NEP1 n=1 Tax=Nosema granulosis TaxID=83296 RepID=A0A9P6GWW1_9MICR|nr:Ribosomal RNA small subunit methyltransferase NEP1 [Nosema granulosis]